MLTHYMCAAFTNGCLSTLLRTSTSPDGSDDFLISYGWRLDYGKWICPNHPVLKEKEGIEYRLMEPTAGFELRFDENESKKYPHGYWYVCTTDGNHDAVGVTVEAALANLVKVLHQSILLRNELS